MPLFQSRSTSPCAALLSALLLQRMFLFRASAFFLRPSSLKGVPTALPRFRGVSSAAIDSSASTDTLAGAGDDCGTTKAIFLKKNGEWVPFANSSIGKKSREALEGLSLQELRQEAQQRGQKTTGPKKVLVERIFSQEPPGNSCTLQCVCYIMTPTAVGAFYLSSCVNQRGQRSWTIRHACLVYLHALNNNNALRSTICSTGIPQGMWGCLTWQSCVGEVCNSTADIVELLF